MLYMPHFGITRQKGETSLDFQRKVCVINVITNKPQAPRGRGGCPADAKGDKSKTQRERGQTSRTAALGLGWAWMWEAGGSRPHLYSKPPGYF